MGICTLSGEATQSFFAFASLSNHGQLLKTNILVLGVIILLCNIQVTLLIRAMDIGGDIEDNSKIFFLISQ